MKDQDWLLNEMNELSSESKEINELRSKRARQEMKRYDTRIFLIFLLLLTPLLVFQVIGGEPKRSHRYYVGRSPSNQSAQWRCSKCHTNIYSEEPDWKGDFYCRKCGTKKGE